MQNQFNNLIFEQILISIGLIILGDNYQHMIIISTIREAL